MQKRGGLRRVGKAARYELGARGESDKKRAGIPQHKLKSLNFNLYIIAQSLDTSDG